VAVHLIWDNSNIFLGGKDTCEHREPEVITYAFRIDFRNVYDLVVNGREVGRRYFGGSVPPQAEALWGFVRGLGCETSLLVRVERGEQAVDEILQLRMSNLLLDFEPPQTMALLSGDGRPSEFGSSFPEQVERAIRKGWNVEIYSWECSMSHKAYDAILQNHRAAMKYIRLDDYYESLTFVKPGNYFYRTNGRSEDIFEQGRDIRPLVLPRR
jgi:hypothetical protein